MKWLRPRHGWPVDLGLLLVVATGSVAQAQSASERTQISVLAATATPATTPAPGSAPIQRSDNDVVSFFRDAEWYFSLGSNKEWWLPTNIHVLQPSLGNNFTVYNVTGHDATLGAGEAPQYSIRVGRFVDDDRRFAIELNLDHDKFYSNLGQTAQVTGLIAGAVVNQTRQLSGGFFTEELHNGANHFMINGVYRLPLIGQTNETLSVAGIGRAGVGVMLPHTTDAIFGNTDDVGEKAFDNLIGFHSGWWQVNGWTAGVELGFRVVLFKPLYFELTDKTAYSDFFDLPAYQGTIQQNMWMNEIVFSLGFTYDGLAK